jgi:hypothetical protein
MVRVDCVNLAQIESLNACSSEGLAAVNLSQRESVIMQSQQHNALGNRSRAVCIHTRFTIGL